MRRLRYKASKCGVIIFIQLGEIIDKQVGGGGESPPQAWIGLSGFGKHANAFSDRHASHFQRLTRDPVGSV